jgi:hypothetical protein
MNVEDSMIGKRILLLFFKTIRRESDNIKNCFTRFKNVMS